MSQPQQQISLSTPLLAAHQIQQLYLLAQINLDSSQGFLTAADIVEESQLQQLFRSCGIARAQFAYEIQRIIKRADQDRCYDPCFLVVIHRWWLLLKNSLSSDSTFSILVEVEKGEDDVKQAYENTLAVLSRSELYSLVNIQYMHVKAVRGRVRKLRYQYGLIEEYTVEKKFLFKKD